MIEGDFSFILIPVNDNEDYTLLTRSKAGGLEKDALQVFAKDHFHRDGDNGEARLQSLQSQLNQQGLDINSIDKKYQSAFMNMSVSLEIVTLQVPQQSNGFVGVSMYCDADGIAKEYKPNTRATRLAHACGQKIIIHGDAFLGRVHDDESLPWERLSIGLDELSESSNWIKNCAKENEGKNLNAYTTAGAMTSSMNNILQPKSQTVSSGEDIQDGNLCWTQNDEEVEIKIIVPSIVTTKNIKVNFKTNRLYLHVDHNSDSFVVGKILAKLGETSQGAELFSNIVVDDSTWTLDKSSGGKNLVITLIKAKNLRWLDLIR